MDASVLLPIIIYVLLAVLIVFLIILCIRLIKTIDKMNIILDDLGRKLVKLDGLVNLIDKTTDYASSINDKIVSKISGFIYKIFKKKKEKDINE